MGEIPFISDEILAYLSRVFPDKCPEKGTKMEDVWYAAGQASVVRHLRQARERYVDQQLET